MSREHHATDSVSMRAIGTAFLVGIGLPERPTIRNVVYVITTKHTLTELQAKGAERIGIRLNAKDGGFTDLLTEIKDWSLHPSNDIAALRVPRGTGDIMNDMDWLFLAVDDEFLTDDYAESQKVTEGSEVFLIGLFSPYSGTEHIQPIVRFGHIALMDHEPLTVKVATEPIKSYLLETRSWAGNSGSPCFVLPYTPGYEARFLGMLSGHYYARENSPDATHDSNAGISYIVRAQDIKDFLYSPEISGPREEFWKIVRAQLAAEVTAVSDSSPE